MNPNQNAELEGVMRRIQKLLAIANDDRANPEEAATAAGMAERIMRKYQLEHQDLILASLKAGDDMSTVDCVASAKTNGTRVQTVPTWASTLAVQVANLNDVGAKVVTTASGDVGIRFYGFKSDVIVAKWMFDYLVAATLRLCNEFKDTDTYLIYGRSAMNSYRMGVSIGINHNLAEQTALKKREAEVTQASAPAGTSLMVVKAQAIAERYGEFKTKPTKSSVMRGGAYSKGVQDGKNVRINSGAMPAASSVKMIK